MAREQDDRWPRPRRVSRERSIIVVRPDLADEIDRERANAIGLDLATIAPGTHARLPWQHPVSSNVVHRWSATGSSRVHMGSGCPVCRGYVADEGTSVAARMPDLAREWHPSLNGRRSPAKVTPGSRHSVAWLCGVCDHVWSARVSSRALDGNGCPRCAGQVAEPGDPVTLAVAQPELFAELDHPAVERLGLDPLTIHVRSQRRVGWQCRNHPKHRWSTSPAARMSGCGCPRCPSSTRSSAIERRLLDLMLSRYADTVGDAPAGNTRWADSRGRMIAARCDVVVPSRRLVVEYDGLRYHRSVDRRRCDANKTAALLADGWRVVRIRERAGTRCLPYLDITASGLLQLSHRYGDRLGPLVETIEAWLDRLDGSDGLSDRHTR